MFSLFFVFFFFARQSMFLDSLVGDAAWRARYAKDAQGETLPFEIHEQELRATHPYAVFQLRSMLAVPYFEKALYELPAEELTAATIASLASEIEMKICGGACSRPLLTVPHILSDEVRPPHPHPHPPFTTPNPHLIHRLFCVYSLCVLSVLSLCVTLSVCHPFCVCALRCVLILVSSIFARLRATTTATCSPRWRCVRRATISSRTAASS